MAVNNRVKHGDFAYRCNVAISSWATGGRRNDLFRGGASAIENCNEPFVRRFHLDCRHLEDLELHTIFFGTDGTLPDIWDRPLVDARKRGKDILAVVKQTRHPELVLSTEEVFEAFWRASSGRLQVQVMFARDGLRIHVWFLRQLLTRCDPKLLLAPSVAA